MIMYDRNEGMSLTDISRIPPGSKIGFGRARKVSGHRAGAAAFAYAPTFALLRREP